MKTSGQICYEHSSFFTLHNFVIKLEIKMMLKNKLYLRMY